MCMIRNMVKVARWGVVRTSSNHQAGVPPIVGCPRLLIEYIRSYPPYLEAVPPHATWGRAMPWWQRPTCHGICKIYITLYIHILNIVILINSRCASSEKQRECNGVADKPFLSATILCLLRSQLPNFLLRWNCDPGHRSTANCCKCSASSAHNCTFQCSNFKFFEVWNVKCSRCVCRCWTLSKESTLQRP